MKDMLDNTEVMAIMEKLEELEDEELAVELLREFNERTKKLGTLVMNQDESIPHDEWKIMCDDARDAVEEIVVKIMSL